MKNYMKAAAAVMLSIAMLFIVGCGKEDNPNNGGNNGGSNGGIVATSIPVVETSPVREIKETSAIGSGVVTSDGGGNIVERGVCWSTQNNPIVSGNHAIAGTGAGTFSCDIVDLAPNTTYYVRAYAINGEGVGYGNVVNFTTSSGNGGGDGAYNGHDYVDLSLPSGTLWATCNVGADAPEESGDYFAWGETTPKTFYDWSTNQYYNGHKLTKYCTNSGYGYNGFTDDLTELQPGDDAVTANWGSGWRMPTKAQWEELMNNTTMTWTTQSGRRGCMFTASNGKSLFLPVAGFRFGSVLEAANGGYYWSSSLYTDRPSNAWCFLFASDNYYINHINRYNGCPVRAVRSAPQN